MDHRCGWRRIDVPSMSLPWGWGRGGRAGGASAGTGPPACENEARATMPSDGNTAMQAGKDARAAGGHLAAGENAGPPGAPAGEMTPHDPGTEWDYAPAPESRDIVTLEPEYGLFLNGEFVPATGAPGFPTAHPAPQEPHAPGARARAA